MRFVTHIIAAAVVATFGVAAMAQEPITRAEVRAETAAAVAAEQIPYGQVTHDESYHFVSAQTLAEARAEVAAAVANGEIPYGQVTHFADDVDALSKSRLKVRSETIEALRLGLIPYGEIAVDTATY